MLFSYLILFIACAPVSNGISCEDRARDQTNVVNALTEAYAVNGTYKAQLTGHVTPTAFGYVSAVIENAVNNKIADASRGIGYPGYMMLFTVS